MDTKVTETARAILDGTISFADVVRQLHSAGVEYYHVDYMVKRTTFYGVEGDTIETPIGYERLPPVAHDLDIARLRMAIQDSRHYGQKYRDFTCRAMEAGVQGYFAFLRGQRVTYLGRGGGAHTEWFPGAEPRPQKLVGR